MTSLSLSYADMLREEQTFQTLHCNNGALLVRPPSSPPS